MFLFVGLGLLLIVALGVYMHWHHLYHWSDEAGVQNDPILKGKASFLNKNWYLFGTVIFVGTWAFFASKLRGLSLEEDRVGTTSFTQHNSM